MGSNYTFRTKFNFHDRTSILSVSSLFLPPSCSDFLQHNTKHMTVHKHVTFGILFQKLIFYMVKMKKKSVLINIKL
jgi:hypothetical protein